jgi:diguanylate cyclase (GGDEF)-like protein
MKTNNNFHILIVDDEKFNIELAAVYLKEEGYRLSFALHAKGALEQVMKNEINLILLDINMPKIDGFELCKMLKEDSKTKDIPIIFLTAQIDIEYISRAFEVGGVDYISKPFNGVELKARVKTHLQNLAYLDEIKDKQSKLAQLSITDPLTKLYNSLYFDAQIKTHQTQGKEFWLIYMKLDNFEKLNKVYGFNKANKIIRIFSKIIESASFSNATVARLHGINFAVLLKDYERSIVKKLYEDLAIKVTKDKNLGQIVTFSTILYHVTDSSLSLPMIYKNIQLSLDGIQNETSDKYLFLK